MKGLCRLINWQASPENVAFGIMPAAALLVVFLLAVVVSVLLGPGGLRWLDYVPMLFTFFLFLTIVGGGIYLRQLIDNLDKKTDKLVDSLRDEIRNAAEVHRIAAENVASSNTALVEAVKMMAEQRNGCKTKR